MRVERYLGQVVDLEALGVGVVEEVSNDQGDIEDCSECRVFAEIVQTKLEISHRLADFLLKVFKVNLESPETQSSLAKELTNERRALRVSANEKSVSTALTNERQV